MHKLITVSAPSGAGKTTFCDLILRDFADIKRSISYTTRSPRGEEKNGRDYFFISEEEFSRMIRQDELAEYARVHGNYYGTSKKFIEDNLRKHHLLFNIDIQGTRILRSNYHDKILSIFIVPPSLDVLRERLEKRGEDTEAVIQQRLKNAEKEIEAKNEFDAVIVNDALEPSYQKLKIWLTEGLK